MLEQEEEVGEIAPGDEEEKEQPEEDGDKTPRQVYLSPAELEQKKRKELTKFQ